MATTEDLLTPEIKAEWTAEFVNELPDSAFLYVEPAGEKDESGKSTPRSLRHFPVRDASGKVDLDHVRNALSRIPQSNVSDDAKASASAEAQRMLNEAEKSITKRTTIDARVHKVAGFTFDQVQTAVSEALKEKYPTPEDGDAWCDGPWIRDIFDDSVVFTYQGTLMSIPYAFNNGTVALTGDAASVKVVYQPMGSGDAAPPPPDASAATANLDSPEGAAAGKRAVESELFAKGNKGATDAIAALKKSATPSSAATAWPQDMSPIRKR